VEALCGHRAKGAQISSVILRKESVGVVLNQNQVVAAGNLGDCLHLARDPAIVHDADGPRSRCHGALDECGVDV